MSDPRPDLEQLRLLVSIADHESLGAAARSLGVAQPNASRSLRRLERQLGISLVVRSPTGSRLTSQGTVVVHWAREVVEACDRLVSGAKALAAESSANLAIAASMTVAEYLLPRWLAGFRREHPGVEVSLTVLNSEGVLDQVREGRQDAGFVETTGVPRGVHSTVVHEDELVVVVAPGHPWARRRRRVTPAELAATALVVRESGSGTLRTLDHALAAHGLHKVAPAQSLSSNTAVRVAAMAGTAPAVLSELAVHDAVAAGDLVAVPVAGLELQRRLRAVWTGGRRPVGEVADFVTLARKGR